MFGDRRTNNDKKHQEKAGHNSVVHRDKTYMPFIRFPARKPNGPKKPPRSHIVYYGLGNNISDKPNNNVKNGVLKYDIVKPKSSGNKPERHNQPDKLLKLNDP